MIALIVSASDDKELALSDQLKNLGYSSVRYSHVLKAIDNLDEISPSLILISADDFPRHWKTFVGHLKSTPTYKDIILALLKDGVLKKNEKAKALHLGLDAVIDNSETKDNIFKQLKNFLDNHISGKKTKKELSLIFSHPENGNIFSGNVKGLSLNTLVFMPADGQTFKDLSLGQRIEETSLRIGETIISPICTVEHIGEFLTFTLNFKKKADKKIIEDYT